MRQDLVEIDLSDAQSKMHMHQRLATSLDFPGWYGNNDDALWDAITGLVDMPYTLRFLGWQDFSRRLPDLARGLTSMLDEMATRYPTLASTVVYD